MLDAYSEEHFRVPLEGHQMREYVCKDAIRTASVHTGIDFFNSTGGTRWS